MGRIFAKRFSYFFRIALHIQQIICNLKEQAEMCAKIAQCRKLHGICMPHEAAREYGSRNKRPSFSRMDIGKHFRIG